MTDLQEEHDRWFRENRELTDEEVHEFIKNLKSKDAPAHYRPQKRRPINQDEPSGNVDAGSTVSFVSGVSGQAREDVLNSTLLAQLAADAKYNRESQTKDWYDFYKYVMGHVYWTIESFSFEQYNASGSSFTMDKAIIEVLIGLLTENEKAVLQGTIDALKALSDDSGAVVIFNEQSVKSSKGNFQNAVAVADGNDVALKTGAFYFNTQNTVTRLLWTSFSSSDTELYKGTQKMVLNRSASGYPKVRDQIVQKLGDRASKFVADLVID